MSSIALHFASGGAFFTGAVCLLAGIIGVTAGGHRLVRPAGRFFILLGLFAIVMSATPLPVWVYIIWVVALVSWIGSLFSARFRDRKWKNPAFPLFIGCTLLAVIWEFRFQLSPPPLRGHWNRLVVIGDSLSAEDFTEGGDPWPKLLAQEHGIGVDNLAFSGAQAASAAKRVASEDLSGALVLLEIGGNDLLGAISADDFERGLERLLSLVCREDNAVVMLELPLPPLYNRYGEIQRRLAQRHGVTLIPKRHFAGIFAGSAATIDNLHLSAAGHQKMSNLIWSLVSPVISHSALRTPHSKLPP